MSQIFILQRVKAKNLSLPPAEGEMNFGQDEEPPLTFQLWIFANLTRGMNEWMNEWMNDWLIDWLIDW